MKRWKVYMVVGFSILAIGCASGCADKKNEIEPIKMVAEVQKAGRYRKEASGKNSRYESQTGICE